MSQKIMKCEKCGSDQRTSDDYACTGREYLHLYRHAEICPDCGDEVNVKIPLVAGEKELRTFGDFMAWQRKIREQLEEKPDSTVVIIERKECLDLIKLVLDLKIELEKTRRPS